MSNLSGGDHQVFPAWVWRVGDSLLVAHANEAYSCFQEDLRAAFPDATVVVMNTSGAEMGYLYPPELDGLDLYQVWQTPFSKDALPTLTEAASTRGGRLFAGATRRTLSGRRRPGRAPVGAPSRQTGAPATQTPTTPSGLGIGSAYVAVST